MIISLQWPADRKTLKLALFYGIINLPSLVFNFIVMSKYSFDAYAHAYEIKSPEGNYLFHFKNGKFTVEKEHEDPKSKVARGEFKECTEIPEVIFQVFLFNYSNRIEKKNKGAMLSLVESFGGGSETVDARKSMVTQLLFNPYREKSTV